MSLRPPYLNDGDVRLYLGDCIEVMREMDAESVQTCVTSPPYWGLRDYGHDGQIGLEETPEAYVARLVDVFREVRRVLRDDGTLWLNLGDLYAAGGNGSRDSERWPKQSRNANGFRSEHAKKGHGVKPKDLVGIPWRVAFALQADGWYLRSDIIWAKPNPMPESVTDRPTKAHEYVFLLSKSARYFYDADSIRTPLAPKTFTTFGTTPHAQGNDALGKVKSDNWGRSVETRKPRTSADGTISGANARTVWAIASKPYAEAHFATFPPELPERCIKAGSREGDVVLDPFVGSGTTAWVARTLRRNAVGIDLSAEYLRLAGRRLQQLSLLGGSI